MAFPRRCRSVDESLWLVHTIRKSMEPQMNRSLNKMDVSGDAREGRTGGRQEAPDGFQEEGLAPSLPAGLPQLGRGRGANQAQVARPPASSQQLSGQDGVVGEDGGCQRKRRSWASPHRGARIHPAENTTRVLVEDSWRVQPGSWRGN